MIKERGLCYLVGLEAESPRLGSSTWLTSAKIPLKSLQLNGERKEELAMHVTGQAYRLAWVCNNSSGEKQFTPRDCIHAFSRQSVLL